MDPQTNSPTPFREPIPELNPPLIQPEAPYQSGQPWWKSLLSVVWFLAVVVGLIYLINGFGLQSYQVVGSSMETTLSEGNRLIISKLGHTTARIQGDDYIPKRGDIIVFRNPLDNSTQLIKRVIGLPEERVKVENGKITVYNDDQPGGFDPDKDFDAEFVYTTGTIDTIVPEGEVFVAGDNRAPGASFDSRNDLGTIPSKYIEGKLVLRLFPIGDAKFYQ